MEFEERRQGGDRGFPDRPPGRSRRARLEERVSDVVARGEAIMLLDCGRIGFVSSAGLRALLLSARMCYQAGGTLGLAAMRPECRAGVERKRTARVLDHRETVQAALAAREQGAGSGNGKPVEGGPGIWLTVGQRKVGSALVMFPVGRLSQSGAHVWRPRYPRPWGVARPVWCSIASA